MLGLLLFLSALLALVNGELTEHSIYTREDASGEGQCCKINSLWTLMHMAGGY